jgi:hypothetical protein
VVAVVGCYGIVAVATALYFAPRIVAWGKMDPHGSSSPQLKAATHRWLALSWMRQSLVVVAVAVSDHSGDH